ncbi:MAG: DNA damage-inducible protein D [Methylocystaceae bacterium]|nr:DNA damage-inducible protein D [Methylocystaceae bacterium]
MDELIQRSVQTDSNELRALEKASFSEDTIDDLIQRFEEAVHANEYDQEYWYARELQTLLAYGGWQKFSEGVIPRAIISCKNSGVDPDDHFIHVDKMVGIGSDAERTIGDIMLTRYACYLIAQNADARKKPVAFAQTYFAIQTRRQELEDQKSVDFDNLSEDQKRLYMRNQVTDFNKKLASAAKSKGVETDKDFAIFQSKGYQGLYGGRTVKEIRSYKQLPQKAKILDHMGSVELAANLFRITQTEQKLRNDSDIRTKAQANNTHYDVGKQVRDAMLQISGTLPEDLPVARDVKKLEQKKGKKVIASKSTPVIENKPINLRKELWKYTLLVMAKEPNGEISTTKAIEELPKYIVIPEESKAILEGRKDSKFSQLVRNLKSHKTSKTNFIYQGYAESIERGFRITQKGLEFVKSEFSDRIL